MAWYDFTVYVKGTEAEIATFYQMVKDYYLDEEFAEAALDDDNPATMWF